MSAAALGVDAARGGLADPLGGPGDHHHLAGEPSGRDETGAARGASHRAKLRSAVRSIDRARGAREVAVARVLDVWQGLIDGRWSIVDRHDSDGRRFIVAVPNELGVPDRTSLTRQEVQVAALACEGYSDKWIGYTLGLARSTVATHLASAMAKLGVSSRVGLSTTFQPCDDASHGPDHGPGGAS